MRRLAELPLILAALKRNTLMDASFVGYPNGEFILFRPFRRAEERACLRRPTRRSAGAVGRATPKASCSA